jgi:hypothetical protein
MTEEQAKTPAPWHAPMSEDTRKALEKSDRKREPGDDDGDEDMRSIGEMLTAGGWKPKPMILDKDRPAEYWTQLIDEHWKSQQKQIFPTMNRNGVPRKFIAELQARPSRPSSAINAMDEWGRTDDLLVVISGDPQVGKSYAVADWLSRQSKIIRTQFGTEPWLEHRYAFASYLWQSAPALAALLDLRDFEAQKKRKALEEIPLLVLDEVGGESIADVSKVLEPLVIKRWAENKRTVMTTNMAATAFAGEVKTRIYERLKRTGQFLTVAPFDSLL